MSSQKNPTKVLLFLLLGLYIVLVLFGVYHHEPWRDEAHPWVSAKEDSIRQIVDSVRYSPTPILWTLLLTPLAKLGLPYGSMGILHASIAVLGIGLLLFLSRIPTALKILIPFSYYLAYEYAVIARQYVLTCFLLFCIASVYSKRLEKPLLYALFVSLLFQTNFYSALPAGVLAGMFCLELVKQKKVSYGRICAVFLMIVSATFTFITYLPHPQSTNQGSPQRVMEELPKIGINSIASSLYNKIFDPTPPLLHAIIIALTVMVFLSFFLSIIHKKDIFFLAMISFIWLLFTNLFLHAGTLRHHGLFLVYLIFFLWISPRYTRSERSVFIMQQLLYAGLSILLLFSVASTIYVYSMDYQYNFSGAADMASFIKRNNLLTKNIVVYTASDGEALLPYLDKKDFWYPELGIFTRYHINDTRATGLPWLSGYDIIRSAYKHFDGESVLYLMSQPLPEEYTGFTLLHASYTGNFWGNDREQFWLYARTP